MQAKSAPKTTMEKLTSMDLAPSLKITYPEQLQVLRYILGTIPAVIYDAKSARKFIFQTQYQLRVVTNDEDDFPEVNLI